MKNGLLLLSAILSGASAIAQIKIGGSGAPDASAILELNSSNRGLLMPRIALTTTTTRGLNGGMPVVGMSVYNTHGGITSSNASYPAAWTCLQVRGPTPSAAAPPRLFLSPILTMVVGRSPM